MRGISSLSWSKEPSSDPAYIISNDMKRRRHRSGPTSEGPALPLRKRPTSFRGTASVTFRRPLSSLGKGAYAIFSLYFMLARIWAGIRGGDEKLELLEFNADGQADKSCVSK